MARPTGNRPSKTIKKTRKLDDGTEVYYDVPCCAGCKAEMETVSIPTLQFWQPGFAYVRKYPFTEAAYFCENCRVKYELEPRNYIMVPKLEDQSFRKALVAYLDTLPPED